MTPSRAPATPDTEWLVNQIAHVLRNPLFAAQVQMEALALRTAQVPETRRAIETLQRQLKRLEETINDMLLFGRPAELRRTTVMVAELVTTIVQGYRRGGRQEPAEVTVEIANPALDARWDTNAVRVILERIIDNAIQHTPPPHRVELRVEPTGDGNVVLAVRDDGEGIPDDLRDRVLLPFYPQHRGRPGLGLAIANKFATLLGGHIGLDSRPGAGTEVRVTLPLVPPPA
jgi:two-component system, NtrC family, sensor histidine kinase KinB